LVQFTEHPSDSCILHIGLCQRTEDVVLGSQVLFQIYLQLAILLQLLLKQLLHLRVVSGNQGGSDVILLDQLSQLLLKGHTLVSHLLHLGQDALQVL
jgi:hypothetical protein